MYEGENWKTPDEARFWLLDLGYKSLTDIQSKMINDCVRIMLEIAEGGKPVDFHHEMRDYIATRHDEFWVNI